jgi:mRNA-degrading endonuclease RelE of RelBE toxin-antitoxin system
VREYEPFYTKSFQSCLRKYRDKRERVEKLINRILQNPIQSSHLLTKKKGIDLRGKRSRHLTGNFVVVYIVCEECIESGFYDKGYNNCSICKGEPKKRVVFLAFGKHQDVYSKEWI